MATLVRGQFRHDMQFRLAVLGLLPLTFVYVFMALQDGPLPDPFVERGFVACLSAILAWSFGDIRHGIAHSVVLGLFARLVVQMRVVAGPQLPFSQP